VTDFLAGTAGFGVSAAAAIVPEVTRSNAECTSLIKDGRSLAGTELLLTYAETMSAASSMKLLVLEVSLMALDIPEEKVSPVVYGLNSDDLSYTQNRPNKALLPDFCESTFKNSDLSKGNAWFPQVAMHKLYCIEAKKAFKDVRRAQITRRQGPRHLPDLCCAWRAALKEEMDAQA
jgi:hypothetical protein